MTLKPIIRLFLIFLTLCITSAFFGCAGKTPPPKTAEIYFKEAEESFSSGNYEEAVEQWKKAKETYSSPELTALAELRIADAHFENKSYIEAAAAYEDFRKLHPNHEKAAYALYKSALCHYKEITGVDRDQTPVKNSINLLEELVDKFPRSEYVGDANKKLEELRLQQAMHEIYVGRFYLRSGKYTAAAKRLEEYLKSFPGLAINDEALYYLGQAYIRNGDKAKGKDTFVRLSQEFPRSKYVDAASKFLAKNY